MTGTTSIITIYAAMYNRLSVSLTSVLDFPAECLGEYTD
jgi:hypothetical protein